MREYYALLPPPEYFDQAFITLDECVQILEQIKAAVANAIKRLLGSAG